VFGKKLYLSVYLLFSIVFYSRENKTMRKIKKINKILPLKNNVGFTLLEVLVSITIFILVLGSIFVIFSFAIDKDRKLMESQYQLSNIRIFIDQFSKELKNTEVNTFINRDTTICPRINEIFKLGENLDSISFLIEDRCIRYKIGVYGRKNRVLLRDEEDALSGSKILVNEPVLDPNTEIASLNFFITGINNNTVTTNLRIGNLGELPSEIFNYQFTIKNNKSFSLKNKYEIKKDNYGLGLNSSFCKILSDKNYIYAIRKNSAIEIFDLDSLSLVGSLSGSIAMSEIVDVVIYNNFLVIFGLDSTGQEGWYRVVNILPVLSGKSPVQVVGGSGFAPVANFLALKDNYLYVSHSSDGFIKGGIDIYSISSDGNLNLENSFIETNNYSGHLYVHDSHLYEESWGDDSIKRNLKEYDISNPSNPLLINIYQNIDPGSMVIKDDLLYTSGDGFNIYQASNIGGGKLNKKRISLNGYGSNIQIVGSDIFLNEEINEGVFYKNNCSTFSSSYIINVVNPLSPFVSNSYLGGLDIVRIPYSYRRGIDNIEILKLFEMISIVER
jgi:competence protein ComGF